MVTHRRRRTILTVLGLYLFAALFIGYFGVNAFTGNHGLRAQQDLEQQLAAMKDELGQLKAERGLWERRVSLLRPDLVAAPPVEAAALSTGGLKFSANFGAFCAIPYDGVVLSPPGDLSYWGLESLPASPSQLPDAFAGSVHGGRPKNSERRRQIRGRLQQGAGAFRLSDHADHPPFRGKGGANVWHGSDWGLLPSVYRPGSGGRWHADGSYRRRPGHHWLPRPRPYDCNRHGPEGRHGRTHRPRAWVFQRQGRLHAHVQRGEGILRRPWHCRRAGS